MNDQIREQLIGYVLGALDEQERCHVERQLGSDPDWRRELELVQTSLAPLAEAYVEYEPPGELAHRTCVFVSDEASRLEVERPRRRNAAVEGGYDILRRWRMADWVVVTGLCLAAVGLFFPALVNSRLSANIIACQNNFRELGIALGEFSETTRERYFPPVATVGNRAFAGFYACELRDSGFLLDSRRVICPDSPLANQLHSFRIPSRAEIDAATGDQILLMQRMAGGSYAYSLGYVRGGQHFPPRNLGRGYFVLMADAPVFDFSGSGPHGKGTNVLYEDCSVRFVCDLSSDSDILMDHPYYNRLGRTEAGTDIDDAVVAPSYYPPLMKNTSCGP